MTHAYTVLVHDLIQPSKVGSLDQCFPSLEPQPKSQDIKSIQGGHHLHVLMSLNRKHQCVPQAASLNIQ